MDKKKRKEGNRRVSIIITGMLVLLFASYLFLTRPAANVIGSGNNQTYNVTKELENTSEGCRITSTGIDLCELPPEQREKEELKERLNKELAGKQNVTKDVDTYAPETKVTTAGIIVPTTSVRLIVALPGSDYADLVAENLRKADGITDVYWSPPNKFDIKYDAARIDLRDILAMDIFKEYNASVVSIT
jgi:hypothetical protein